jgi:hypothetical protein
VSKALDKELDDHLRSLLVGRLQQLKPHQRDRFKEIWGHPYPGKNPVFAMTKDQVYNSIDLCDRTLASNDTEGKL